MIVAKGSGIDSNIRQQYANMYLNEFPEERYKEMSKAIAQAYQYSSWATKSELQWAERNKCLYCGVQYQAQEVQCTKCGGPR